MRLKIEFKYQCEVEVKEGEAKNFKNNVKYGDIISDLSKEINKSFLQDDGRTEAGGVVEFDYEIKED